MNRSWSLPLVVVGFVLCASLGGLLAAEPAAPATADQLVEKVAYYTDLVNKLLLALVGSVMILTSTILLLWDRIQKFRAAIKAVVASVQPVLDKQAPEEQQKTKSEMKVVTEGYGPFAAQLVDAIVQEVKAEQKDKAE